MMLIAQINQLSEHAFSGFMRTVWLLVTFFIIALASNTSAKDSFLLIPAEVVGLGIDHPKLAAFLHPEVSERVPLVTSDHLLKPRIHLRKFSRQVLIVSGSIADTRPSIRFLSFQKKEKSI